MRRVDVVFMFGGVGRVPWWRINQADKLRSFWIVCLGMSGFKMIGWFLHVVGLYQLA